MATLKMGSRGDDVAQLQTLLNQLGYGPLDVDGIFGSKTRAAVRAFQKASGLTADGVVGPQTEAALSVVPTSGKDGTVVLNPSSAPMKTGPVQVTSGLTTTGKVIAGLIAAYAAYRLFRR